MDFSSRQIELVILLLTTDKTMSANELALNLQISKRTVFRELENLDIKLKEYGFQLNTKKGIQLDGEEEKKSELLKLLKGLQKDGPKNKEERQEQLILEFLKQEEPKKIYYYADLLQVSEATISKDMDVVEAWFERNDIRLIRKPGYGIYLECSEEHYQKAVLHYIVQVAGEDFKSQLFKEKKNPAFELLNTEVTTEVFDILESLKSSIKRMTKDSYYHFLIFLAIKVDRILSGKVIEADNTSEAKQHGKADEIFVKELARELEDTFDISLSGQERSDIIIFYKGCKVQYADEVIEAEEQKEHLELRYIVYEMINRYDVVLAYELKQDEEFIRGLLAHLQPTITRLKHGMEIGNPLLAQIIDTYPEIYRKTEQASQVITKHYGCTVSEEEIGLLVLHFGGAEVRLENKKRTRRKVMTGVVCANGIGFSSMLSSSLAHAFQDKIKVRTLSNSELEDLTIAKFDIIVSTFQLDHINKPYIQVNPMLSAEDLEKISEQIEYYAYQKAEIDDSLFENSDMYEAAVISNEMNSIMDSFKAYRVDKQISFQEIMRYSSELLGEDDLSKCLIYDDLSKREQLSTQVIPEFELVLLHAKTRGVKDSKLILILPKDEFFTDDYLQKTKVVIVMLIPEEDARRTRAISSISRALFDDDTFLNIIKSGDEKQSIKKIQYYLKQYFMDCLREIYENEK